MSPSILSTDEVTPRRVTHAVGLLLLVVVVLAVVLTTFPGLVGAEESFVVRSNSMSPAIGAGSVVFVDDVSIDEIGEEDVITFESGGSAENRVTHRVVEVIESDGARQFRTKGDANDDPDADLVNSNQVVGKVSFSLPLIGHLISIAGTNLGLILFVVVPALALVVLELWDLVTGDDGGDGT